MSKFTQGEWEWDKENCLVFTTMYSEDGSSERYYVADFEMDYAISREEREANARLIAAAPEMYELLKSLVNTLLAHSYSSYSQDKVIRIANLLARIDGEEEVHD